MILLENFELPKQRGKQVYQILTNTRAFFALFPKGQKFEEEMLQKYLQKGETAVSIKREIEVVIPE